MSNKEQRYISSRQSPYVVPYKHYIKSSSYGHIFFEDFSQGFSSTFMPIGTHDAFYHITPENDALRKLLLFKHSSNLDALLDQLLGEIMCYLLINGKTYVEIVPFLNQEEAVNGIEFVCVPAKRHWVRHSKYTLTARESDGRLIKFDIDLNRLVIFDLKDLGFHRNYFRKLANRLTEFDATNGSELMLDPKMKGIFDYEKYHKSIDFKLLKGTRSIYWYGRSSSNQYLSESYLLYREMQYKNLRYKFLEYILGQINAKMDNLKAEWGFLGKITAGVSLSHYEESFFQYSEGKINTSQLCKIVLYNLMPKEIIP